MTSLEEWIFFQDEENANKLKLNLTVEKINFRLIKLC